MADPASVSSSPLHEYISLNNTYYRIYERYKPDTDLLAKLHEARLSAHVVVASRYACPDCARNLPRMTRIAEHLPGWTWDVFDSGEDEARKSALGIVRIPTFIVYDKFGGRELGRIIENPVSGSLLKDLLGIVGAAG